MRALDPRLLRRTRSARPLLTVDAVLGVCVALAVLLQASLLALIIARAFHGAPLHALWVDIGLLLIAFLARGALAWGMEMAGRRAAWSVLSELRLALIEKRLRAQPTAVDGTEGAEIATVSVQGIEALEGYFARYLPQVVLAAVVPLLVLVWVAIVDLETALIMLLTLAPGARVHGADRPLHRAPDRKRAGGPCGASRRIFSTWSEACRRCARLGEPTIRWPCSARSASATASRPWRRSG